jgi:hypothetical protein
MSWIKRNLALVISGVIALGLFGLGGWYLYSAIDKNKTVDNEISGAKAEIDRLLNSPVTPNDENLKLAKQEAAKIAAFIADAKKQFPATPPPPVALNNQSFKELLQTTVDGLTKQANSVGIKIDTNYYFTFEQHRLPVMFPPDTLRPMADQLHEIQRLASLLFKSRINRLVGMRRAAVPGEQTTPAPGGAAGANTAGDYLNTPPRGNAETGMALWPYEVTFDCFTAELGTVMEALARAENGFIVKAPVVDVLPDRSQEAPKPQPGVKLPPPPPLTTVINERLLRVTLRLDVIKPTR